jgi:hypothetical protein
MRVVGESHYQAALRRLQRTCVPGAEGRPSFSVALAREPDNPYDAHAITVMSAMGCVGYLPRDDARRYGPTLLELHVPGTRVDRAAHCSTAANVTDRALASRYVYHTRRTAKWISGFVRPTTSQR